MLKTLVKAKLIIPLLLTIVGLTVLLSLGTWQMERKAWKEGLIASIQEGMAKQPVALPTDPDAWPELLQKEYNPVTFTGEYLHQFERHFFALEKGRIVWHVYTPVKLPSGPYVLVNRGSVPEDKKDPSSRTDGQLEGEQQITGLIRKPGQKGPFDVEPNQTKNEWYWRDLEGMAAGLRSSLGPDSNTVIVPFFVDATAELVNPGGLPKGGATRVKLTNKHLEYALTWFGLALVLLGVFIAYAVTSIRAVDKSSTN